MGKIDRISYRLTTSIRPFTVKRWKRDISTSHRDSHGSENQREKHASRGSVRSQATGDSQGPRPVLSRFAAARTAVACREFVG